MFQEENVNLEFKEAVSQSFLKTVSAYANYGDGTIIFGVRDKGQILGLTKPEEVMLQIENMVNDSIDPRPIFSLHLEDKDGKFLVFLHVRQGKDAPYYFKGKAYKRSATSTLPLDRQELNRLLLKGLNLTYEASRAEDQSLEFKLLEEKMKSGLGIDSLTLDILKTLGLYAKEGYFNRAALLLSDRPDLPMSGVDMVKFGDNINLILFRGTSQGVSILAQFDYALEIFERYYQYQEIIDYKREDKQLIPKAAFREALANALVHREWDLPAHIQIAMYQDRIEINSPGGLPLGMSQESYLNEYASILRNPIIAGVFHRLGLIEKFGTGVARILNAYEGSYLKPKFKIGPDNIRVTLPFYKESLPYLSQAEHMVYDLIQDQGISSRSAIDAKTGFDKSKTLRVIRKLLDKELIKKEGRGPGTSYRLS